MNDALMREILSYLDCPRYAPTLRSLNRLIRSYIRTVPWESVSRIVKRHETSRTEDCPRLSEEFWRDAIQSGFGGTCFESSFAFHDLLTALGYEAYLTVNDMGTTRACHGAIVVVLDAQKYLVDVTIPVHAAVCFDPDKVTKRRTAFQDYTIRPVRENAYNVERSHHPSRNAFTLIDVPISPSDYRKVLENDYTETGLFLKSVVVVKVVDNKAWRFFSDHKPYRLESFSRAGKDETPLRSDILPRSLAQVFRLPEDKISTALSWASGVHAQSALSRPYGPMRNVTYEDPGI